MEVWKIMFLSKWVICRFHVNLPGCKLDDLDELMVFEVSRVGCGLFSYHDVRL